MRAAVLRGTGSVQELQTILTIEEVSNPHPDDNEILIRVSHASMNRRDLYIAQGLYSKIRLPVIPGSDCSGVIEEVGKSVRGFSRGERVVINPSVNWGSNEVHQSKDYRIFGMPDDGTFAEYVKAGSSSVCRMPEHLDFAEASALPLAGLTAYRALFSRAGLRHGENVLVTGIGGGVASFALLFAVAAGAKVFVTSGSSDKIQKATALGASGGALYTNENWQDEIAELSGKKIDVIIDGAGGRHFPKLIELASYGGRIAVYGVTMGSPDGLNLYRIYWKQLSILGSTMGSDSDFMRMLEFVSSNKIKPAIDSKFSLSNIVDAFERMSSGKQFGKILLEGFGDSSVPAIL